MRKGIYLLERINFCDSIVWRDPMQGGGSGGGGECAARKGKFATVLDSIALAWLTIDTQYGTHGERIPFCRADSLFLPLVRSLSRTTGISSGHSLTYSWAAMSWYEYSTTMYVRSSAVLYSRSSGAKKSKRERDAHKLETIKRCEFLVSVSVSGWMVFVRPTQFHSFRP